MRNWILVLTLVIVFGCSNNTPNDRGNKTESSQSKESEKLDARAILEPLDPTFKQFLSYIPELQLPASLDCADSYSNFPKIPIKLLAKFVDGAQPYRRIPFSDSLVIVILNIRPADTELPVIKTYNRSGELISSMNMFINYCGADPGFVGKADLRIDESQKISRYDSIWSFGIDSFDEKIEGTEILKTIVTNYSINSKGELVKEFDTLDKISNLKFDYSSGQAVLIGENIQILDEKLKNLRTLSTSGIMIKIKGISERLINPSNEICDSYWLVKIKGEDFEGIVDGRKVFQFQYSKQDTVFKISENEFEIFTTDFLGMGTSSYEGDLLGCPVNQPVILKDSTRGYFGLVKLKRNEYSKEASWDGYSFFELRSDDCCYDKIKEVVRDGENVILKIKRGWQEGYSFYDVRLSYNGKEYVAEYLNFGERIYE